MQAFFVLDDSGNTKAIFRNERHAKDYLTARSYDTAGAATAIESRAVPEYLWTNGTTDTGQGQCNQLIGHENELKAQIQKLRKVMNIQASEIHQLQEMLEGTRS